MKTVDITYRYGPQDAQASGRPADSAAGATRYSTSGFLRTKLGDALSRRELAPHIYENAEEASAHLHKLEDKVAS
jgi:hypothetical protein